MLKRFLLIAVVLLLAAVPGRAEPLPRIETEQPVFDFGVVMRGEAVVHTFEFRNSGDADLVVDRVKSTCGCTGVLLSEKQIPPGGTGTVKATFNSSRFQGQVEKRILLYSNAPGGQPVSFALTGIVKIPLETNPSRLYFGQVPIGQAKAMSTVLTNNSGQPIKLVNLRTSNAAFRAEVDSDTLEAGASTELRVIAEPGAQDKHLGGAVLIRLDRADLGEINIPVTGSVIPVPAQN